MDEEVCPLPKTTGEDGNQANEFADIEYDVQLHGTSLKEVLEAEASNQAFSIDVGVDNMMKFLENFAGEGLDYGRMSSELKKKLLQAIPLTLETMKPDFEQLLKVPRDVLLPEDAPQQGRYTAHDLQTLERQREDLLLRKQKAEQLRCLIQEELSLQNEMLSLFKPHMTVLENQLKDLKQRYAAVTSEFSDVFSALQDYKRLRFAHGHNGLLQVVDEVEVKCKLEPNQDDTLISEHCTLLNDGHPTIQTDYSET